MTDDKTELLVPWITVRQTCSIKEVDRLAKESSKTMTVHSFDSWEKHWENNRLHVSVHVRMRVHDGTTIHVRVTTDLLYSWQKTRVRTDYRHRMSSKRTTFDNKHGKKTCW